MFVPLLAFFQLALCVVARISGDVYSTDPNVYELTPANFDKVVYRSNYTSIVKFYAPWCGYCQRLEPVWRKMARFLHQDGKYAVNVASVNCDSDRNKALCSKHRIQGFPTVIVFRPPKWKSGATKNSASHVPEVYNGERALGPMIEFVSSRIKNYVKKFHRFDGDSLSEWLSDTLSPRVFLMSSSPSITPLYKTMAIDFLGSASLGMITLKETPSEAHVDVDGVKVTFPLKPEDKLPLLFLYKPEEHRFIRYKGKNLKNKQKIEQWLIDETGTAPGEGVLSKKDKKYYSKYRGHAKDEL